MPRPSRLRRIAKWVGLGVGWLLFLVTGINTVILRYRDRRAPPGYCPDCGYILTAHVSGVCPECATAVPKQETTA